jgi:tRNA threonylcarbamoyladenosine biosynthesis protein TsaB
MEPRLLILETSHRRGFTALAQGTRILGERPLDEARRHARDLAPACAELLRAAGWKPADLHGVIVSRGPGSYTGLRVGVMSAKTLAYATGCALLGVETFAAIALQAPDEARTLDVIADAQQDKVYVQRFDRAGEGWQARTPLAIVPAADWIKTLTDEVWVSGPGLEQQDEAVPPGTLIVPQEHRYPRPASLLQIGLARYAAGERDDPFALEPLYLRPSSAEEKWETSSRASP